MKSVPTYFLGLIRVLIGILLLFFVGNKLSAQIQQLKFNQFEGTSGISLGKINGMTMDKYGFMWFSDQSNRSIIRYDGKQMVRFKNDPKNPNSLGGHYPECLFPDPSGAIWIGFYGQGLDKYDPATDTFTHYRHDPLDTLSLANDFVSAVRVDHLGNIWVGTDSGLDLLDEASGTFRHFRHSEGDKTSLSHNMVRSIYEDKSGVLWIGTGIPWEGNSKGGLNRYIRNSETFDSFIHDPDDPTSLINNKVRAILEDSRGIFWVGTAGDGLHTLDRTTGEFTRHQYNPAKPELLSRTPAESETDHITFIVEDPTKQIWIGTMANGITRFDPDTGTKAVYGTAGDASEFYDNSGWWAQANDDGILWISTQQSHLYKVDLFNSIFPHFGNDVNEGTSSFVEESNDIFWRGTVAGLIRHNLKENTFTRFLHDPNSSKGLTNSSITCLAIDRKGTIWIGTEDGLNHYDPLTKIIVRHPYFNVKDSTYLIQSLLVDKNDDIWVGTSRHGLYRIEQKTDKLIKVWSNPSEPNSLTHNDIYALEEDRSGDLWISTGSNAGIVRLNRETNKLKPYISGLLVSSLFRDGDDKIWAGVPEGGLYYFDPSSDRFHSIGENNEGLEIPNVVAIAEDNEKNLWIASRMGLYRLDKHREQLIRFGEENGIPHESNFGFQSAFKRENGDLYFGNRLGYFFFSPIDQGSDKSRNEIYFTDFFINDEKIKTDPKGVLKKSLFNTNEIRLPYSKNAFSISFTEVNFRQNEEDVIYYRLSNYDDTWRVAGADHKVNYYKVANGEYDFQIKTINSQGEWINKSLAIIISPPWWKSNWAFLIYGFIFIGGVYVVHRFQKARVIKAEQDKIKEKERAHAVEIEKAYTQLKSTQAQLIQTEKMASLGELTAGIAHEIQNPLNFVNNFTEVSDEMVSEVLIELKKSLESRDQKLVKELLTNVRDNLQIIRKHGLLADAIVKNMLSHSKQGQGRRELTDLNALANGFLKMAYHSFLSKYKNVDIEDISLEISLDEKLPKVNVIPQEIGKVLLNILNNAFYAVRDRMMLEKNDPNEYKPLVKVCSTLGSCPLGKPLIKISIQDNGVGIPQSVKDKIFQPFFTTKPTGQGTGLGLSLSYDIVQAHKGQIEVHPRKILVLSLPLICLSNYFQ